MKAPDIDAILRKVDAFRESAFGHSQNEKDLMVLADDVKRLRKVLKRADTLCKALPKFNWGASALDADTIKVLNDVPREIKAALKKGADK